MTVRLAANSEAGPAMPVGSRPGRLRSVFPTGGPERSDHPRQHVAGADGGEFGTA